MGIARLRIPTGWSVIWNTLSEPPANGDFGSFDDLTEDLLLISNQRLGVSIDLGWLPEFNPEGRFVLRVVQWVDGQNEDPEAWDHPVRIWESRSYVETRDALEKWLADPTLSNLPRQKT